MLAEYILAIEDAEVRLERLTRQVAATAASWSMAPVIEAYQAMRGVAFLTAVKLKTVAITAIAREMAAFLWAIGQEVAPVAQA